MNPTIADFIPSQTAIEASADWRGLTPDAVRAEVIETATGGYVAGDPSRLEARRAKAEAELAKVAAEEARLQGIAARHNQLTTELARLVERDRQAGFAIDWLTESASARWEQAGQQIGLPGSQPWEIENMVDAALRADAAVAGARKLLDPLRAAIEAKRAEVAAYAAEHGIQLSN